MEKIVGRKPVILGHSINFYINDRGETISEPIERKVANEIEDALIQDVVTISLGSLDMAITSIETIYNTEQKDLCRIIITAM